MHMIKKAEKLQEPANKLINLLLFLLYCYKSSLDLDNIYGVNNPAWTTAYVCWQALRKITENYATLLCNYFPGYPYIHSIEVFKPWLEFGMKKFYLRTTLLPDEYWL